MCKSLFEINGGAFVRGKNNHALIANRSIDGVVSGKQFSFSRVAQISPNSSLDEMDDLELIICKRFIVTGDRLYFVLSEKREWPIGKV